MASFSSFESLNAAQPIADQRAQPGTAHRLLVCLPSLPPEGLQNTLAHLADVFTPDDALIALPNFDQEHPSTSLPLVGYEGARGHSNFVLTALDYLTADEEAEQHDAGSILLLGPDAAMFPASAVRQMVETLRSGVDLVVPLYSLGPHDGLVNSALLYPVTRALFATNIRFPLTADAGMSRRMAARMASVAQRQSSPSQPESLVWPVAEAAVAAFTVRQVDAGTRSIPPLDNSDFNALFTEVAGALFTDVEAKATFWQRARTLTTPLRTEAPQVSEETNNIDEELPSMVESFRLAHNNLQEIWSLVLPPQSLLALKKLSLAEPSAFSMPPALWARIVYDFALGFHLRTLNRGHLLGALTPLYLAWVASTLHSVRDAAASSAHLEATAAAFEHEKPYLLARWRWPDRFNP
jgi:glucosylglycerate synthase